MIYIKYLPKDILLYTLWENARCATYFNNCNELIPKLTLCKTQRDIKFMITVGRNIHLTIYYGKLLFIDITKDYIDVSKYNFYNGKGLAKKIIDLLKVREMQKIICKYYLFF